MGVTEVINRYLYNIAKWEAGVSDLFLRRAKMSGFLPCIPIGGIMCG